MYIYLLTTFLSGLATLKVIFSVPIPKNWFHSFGGDIIFIYGISLFYWCCKKKNYHKFSGLKQHRCVNLKFCESEVWMDLSRLKSRCQQDLLLSEVSREEYASTLLVFGDHPHFLAHWGNNATTLWVASLFYSTDLSLWIQPGKVLNLQEIIWLEWVHPTNPG